jgi:hypothetical protein
MAEIKMPHPAHEETPLPITKRGISYLNPGGIQEAGQGGEIRLQRLRSRGSERQKPLCSNKAVVR